jgi:hypothetical protein
MVAHIKKRMSRTERRASSHTRCPSWRHTGGHRTGYLRVQNQPYSFFNNCKKKKKKKSDLKNIQISQLLLSTTIFQPLLLLQEHTRKSQETKKPSQITKRHQTLTNYGTTVAGACARKEKLMKKSGTTTSELRAIEMQERREFFYKKLHVPYSLCPLTLIPNRQQKLDTGETSN